MKMMSCLLKRLLLLALLLQSALAWAASLTGSVADSDGQPIPGANVFLENTNIAATADANGRYMIDAIPAGKYKVVAFAFGMQTKAVELSFTQQEQKKLDFTLLSLNSDLQEVEISGASDAAFGMTRLNAVEGMAIYEGKKSEVVVMSDLNANLATNNTRQVFSKVAGLNIWESDCAGLQLGVGGRGLSPNRSSNFNTRQNGYDISADPMGYPDAYYSPPMQALEKIEVVRGAASLQYGPQFGGLVNFRLKKGPKDRKIALETHNTVGAYGFVNTFTGIGGTVGKVNYYGYYQFRRGDCWRANSAFYSHAAYGAVAYQVTEKLKISADYSMLHYLAQQAGGLTDREFAQDPRQSKRSRNWFLIDWNVASLSFDYAFDSSTQLNVRTFGMRSGRDAIGNLGRIDRADDLAERTLLIDDYLNVGAEARLIRRYFVATKPAVFLLGGRAFHGNTDRSQGLGSANSDADFNYIGVKGNNDAAYALQSNNLAFFVENIFDLSDKFSITPGLRFEHIKTAAEGSYIELGRDLAGNVIFERSFDVEKSRGRSIFLTGIGASYKASLHAEFYANISQNYRPISFNDLTITIPSLRIDPNLQDESGFNADLGLRGNWNGVLNIDASLFLLHYSNRIGEILQVEGPNTYRYRTNISDSRNLGIETYIELDLMKACKKTTPIKLSVFSNATLLDARYVGSQEPAIRNRRVEYVPIAIVRTGINFGYKQFKATYQLSYTSSQFSDATNAQSRPEAVVGEIPAYYVMDLNLSYTHKAWSAQLGLNNLTNNAYFTRRATGYPGPGIIPSDGRTVYLTVGYKIGK